MSPMVLTVLCSLFVAGFPLGAPAQEPSATLQTREAVLARLPGKAAAYLNGISPRLYVDPTQTRVAYIAKEGGEEFVVLDGRRQAGYEAIEPVPVRQMRDRRLFFSPNGKRYAYVGRRSGAYYLVVDGEERAALTRPTRPFFGPDERLAYEVERSEPVPDSEYPRIYHRMVIEGVLDPSVEYEACRDPVFSPDGRHVAYFAWGHDDNLRLVLDGREQPKFSGDGYPIVRFSPDSRTVGYLARRGEQDVLVINGRERRADHPDYSPKAPHDDFPLTLGNGGHYAYASASSHEGKEEAYAVIDGRRSKTYVNVNDPVLSSDGRHAAFIATDGEDRKCRAVVDGKEGPRYELVSHLQFSPDGRHVAYVAEDGETAFVVVDGTPRKRSASVYGYSVVFSPDSSRLCYFAEDSKKQVLVVEGGDTMELPVNATLYWRAQEATFSPDGRHIAYTGENVRRWKIWVDGHPVGDYDGRPEGAAYVFYAPGRMRTVAVRGNEVLGIDVRCDASSRP